MGARRNFMHVRMSLYNVDHDEIDYDHNMGNGFEKSCYVNVLDKNLSENESGICSENLVKVFYNWLLLPPLR